MARNVRKAYKGLKKDAQHTQVHTGSTLAMQDATATPQKSPLAILTASVTTIAVPSNAAEIVMRCSVDLRVGVDATLADGYYVIPANTPYLFGLNDEDTLYVKGDASNGTLNFYFVII